MKLSTPRALRGLAVGIIGVALSLGCFLACAEDSKPASGMAVADDFIPGRILWVDQNNPLAADAQGAGSEGTPFKTISGAAQRVKPGDLVRIRTGVYREHVEIKASGLPGNPIRFEAATAAHVVVTGADKLDKKAFSRETPETDSNNIFSAAWLCNLSGTHPNDDYHAMVGRREQVVVDRRLMHQVLERLQLSRGSFYIDYDKKKLYLWHPSNLDLSKGRHDIEASTRPVIWSMSGSYLQTRGIVFRYAANFAQQGAVQVKGDFNLLEDCVVEFANGVGISISGGHDAAIRRCVVRMNGQLGVGGSNADRLLLTGCEVRENGIKGYNGGWEAGADKFCRSKDIVLESSIFADNNGNGIWFDIGNENPVVRNCLVINNRGCGIFYEISYGLRAHDNVIVGNGFDAAPGSWGGDGAISLSSSPGCVIERNLMIGNQEGFQFREQGRTAPRIGASKGTPEEPVWNHDQTIRNNVLAYNAKWQVGGWFDVKDHRHWPLSMQTQFDAKPKSEAPLEDIAKDYLAKDAGRLPQSLCLEKLSIAFKDNLYVRIPGEGLFLWGATWHDHKAYSSLDLVRSELKIEEGGIETPLDFANFRTLDLRVSADSLAIKMGCYPKGGVPGVKLGIK